MWGGTGEVHTGFWWEDLMGDRRGAHRVLVGRPDGKGPLGRPRRRWEDNIKMHQVG